ncbi:MAG: hypothetical protein IT379_40975 [Deltaproteobacteria bacterium]|nr:hypothetical protein [Deltaproteobacteria bacterium]
MSKHFGGWQAQGSDVQDPGHRREWGQDVPPTKPEGTQWLGELADMCTPAQHDVRSATACPKALQFVRRAPKEGFPTMSCHFYATKHRGRGAPRIDVEIWGLAFQG